MLFKQNNRIFMNFSSFGFDPRVAAGIAAAGYETPTPIQEKAIPVILGGKDLLGLAQTGTGKTAAFALPILQRLLGGDRCKARVLVISPTRELAEQTHKAFEMLGKAAGYRSMSVFGGVSTKSQIKTLKTRLPEILVACPGRLLDLMGQRVVDLSGIEILVLDEADQMFDMGFLPSIKKIIASLPREHQTLLFSATLPQEIRALAKQFQKDPTRIEIGASKPAETVSHFISPVSQGDKYEALRSVLGGIEEGQTLIFTRTKHRAKKLALQLTNAGFNSTSLQGNLSQGQREKAMASFRSGRAKIMVATDIAARGIDVTQISHVINFDIPDTPEAYTHRVGRTGRMLRKGLALTFVTPEDKSILRSIERYLGKPIERMELARVAI
jgi:ATP-dependent RNA helicase RhlE